jgi:hypothetical protein
MRLSWRTPAVIALTAAALVAACTSGSAASGDEGAGGTRQPDAASTGATTSAPTSAPAKAAAAAAKPNWTSYHGNRARTGVSTTMPTASGTPKVTKKVALDGAVYASPIVVNGVTIVATENDSVYALSSTGKQLWHKKLGTPAPNSQLPCGDIFPLGITGTPTYVPATGLVYVVAEIGSPVRHRLFAIHATTGAIAWHKIVDRSGVTRAAMQQRGALTVIGSHVYIPFGALAGDCGNYKGRVVAVQTKGSHKTGDYTSPTARGGGMWNPGGGSYDGHGHLYVTSANGAAFPGHKYDHTNSLINLKGTKRVGSFAPSTWAADNRDDVGLGSQNAALVGSKWIFIGGKSLESYVLRQGHLGGIGGQVSKTSLCASYGGAVVNGSSVYTPCTDGVRKVTITSKGKISKVWHAASNITGAPVLGGGRIWSLDPKGGTLYEINPTTGATTHSVSVGATSRFATPAIAGKMLIVPTLSGVSLVSTS